MKVAILLTGQLRTFPLLKHLHMNALISKYNADVFLGISTIQSHHNIQEAIDFFKPVDTFVLTDFTEEMNRLVQTYGTMVQSPQNIFIQYYVVKKTYELLLKHTNTTYDLIIRLRFDQYIYSKEVPIPPQFSPNIEKDGIEYNEMNVRILKEHTLDKKFIFDEIQDNTFYVLGFGDFRHYKYSNDQFFYHTASILPQMVEFYDHIPIIMNECRQKQIGKYGALIECILYLYITQVKSIHLKKSNIAGQFLRK